MTSPAVQRYLDLHGRFEGNGAGGSPDWVKEIRAGAIKKFSEIGFPTTRDEDWRFTSVRSVTEPEYAIPDSAAARGAESVTSAQLCSNSYLAVIVDGRYSDELSNIDGLPGGIVFGSLEAAAVEHGEVVSRHLGRYVSTDNAFTALGTAFMKDGVFIHVPANVEVDRPIEIVHLGAQSGAVEYPRVLVVADDNASVRIVESYVAADDEYLRSPVEEVVLGQGARVELCRLQNEGLHAHHMASTHVQQARDSRFDSTFVALGSRLTRHDIRAVMDGEGAECHIRGLYLLKGEQHVDHHTVIDHAKPNCQSNEFLNGVLDDQSRAVFAGRIVVREDAQKTDSKQSNNNVLLSESARADSQPQLEIYADDVRCTHGATLGPLNEDSILYLRTRGIAEAEARKMLTYGFGVEIVDAIGIADVRERLRDMVRQRLGVEA